MLTSPRRRGLPGFVQPEESIMNLTDAGNDENLFSSNIAPSCQGAAEDGESGKSSERRGYSSPRGRNRGGRRGGFSNGEAGDGERPRRTFERRSGTGRGNELKREGSGHGNWGTQADEIAHVSAVFRVTEVVPETEKIVSDEKSGEEEDVAESNKEAPAVEPEKKA